MKPKLAGKARVRPDPRDGVPVLLSPERGLRLSETAAAIVSLCDGTRTPDEIVTALTQRYPTAPPDRIATDVARFLADLHSRALLEDFAPAAPHSAFPIPFPAPDSSFSPPSNAPYTLVAELTHRCALACPYCSNPLSLVPAHDELRTDEWTRVIDESADLGVMQMHLTGGEPLARSDLEPIAERARARDLYVSLVTSGVPLDRARFDRLAAHIDHVQLSVQAADPATSDRIAGFASFDAKLRVAAWVKERGLPLTLNVVLHRDNLDAVADVIALAERLGADRLELANVQLVSWALRNSRALLPTRAQIDRAREVAREAKRRLEGRMEVILVLPDWHADLPRACMDGWARRFLVVAPDGAVLPCHAARTLPLTFDRVRDAPLARIWSDSPALRAFRGDDWMPEPCKSCDRRAVDYGGCRCQAFALAGDARATDPACSLSPHHSLVVAAREEAERAGERTYVYRGR